MICTKESLDLHLINLHSVISPMRFLWTWRGDGSWVYSEHVQKDFSCPETQGTKSLFELLITLCLEMNGGGPMVASPFFCTSPLTAKRSPGWFYFYLCAFQHHYLSYSFSLCLSVFFIPSSGDYNLDQIHLLSSSSSIKWIPLFPSCFLSKYMWDVIYSYESLLA